MGAALPASQIDRWAVVLNPSKFRDPDGVQAGLSRLCHEHGWPEPGYYRTTEDDPGTGQARAAVADGAQLVCSMGGDGTVRAVAQALIDTDIPLGLLPAGTGNLLARNLGLPLDDLPAAISIAVGGRTSTIDAGLVSWDDEPAEVFLVMAGMGLDGEIMATVDENLKRVVGWWAYVASAAKAVFRLGFAVRVWVDDQPRRRRHARTVLVGNCGQLTGGVQLIPQAEVDDGLLDVVIASPNSLFSWVAIGLHLISRRHRGHRAFEHLQGGKVTAVARDCVAAQLDGDAVGIKGRMVCQVRHNALSVRLPT